MSYVPILFALWQISGYTSNRWHDQATAHSLLVLELISARLASIWPRATLVVDATVRSKNHTHSQQTPRVARVTPLAETALFNNNAVTTKNLGKLILQLLLHVDPERQANR